MSVLQAVVLGAVQGLTEFVPISSSGHLVLVPNALDWGRPGLAFDVLLHTASLAALTAYFWSDLREIFRGLFSGERRSRRLALLLVVGTVPAALAGVALGDYFEESFEDAEASAIQLVITGVILIVGELVFAHNRDTRRRRGKGLRPMERIGYLDAGIIGTAQAISILPGISRSGATIGSGLALAIDRADAARFAFLLSIPALLGASILEVPELGDTTLGIGAGAAGFITSLITSYAAIWGLIRYLRTNTLYPFAAYCLIAGPVFYVLV